MQDIITTKEQVQRFERMQALQFLQEVTKALKHQDTGSFKAMPSAASDGQLSDGVTYLLFFFLAKQKEYHIIHENMTIYTETQSKHIFNITFLVLINNYFLKMADRPRLS